MSYYFSTHLNNLSFDEAIQKVTAALKEEGFGILTEIDIQKTMKAKLDEDYLPYRILGACNPGFAHKALQAENKIGAMLPCNIIVQQHQSGAIEVSAVDPIASMQAAQNDSLAGIAVDVQQKLKKVIDAL
jgi:uncharacterized protein (DUF302 family)